MTEKKKKQAAKEKYELLDISKIEEPLVAVRKEIVFTETNKLAESIKQIGLIEPLIVKKSGEKYEVIAGHRRLQACRLAKLQQVACIVVKRNLIEQEKIKMHENKFRKDLSAVEEAKYFSYLVSDMKLRHKKIAEMMNVSESYVSQHLTILDWIPELIEAVDSGKISFTSGRELNRVKDHAVLRGYILHACRHGITPNVALSWYQQWESMRLISEGIEDEVLSNISGPSQDVVMYKCHFCSQAYEFDETVMVRICPDCLEMIEQAIRQERRMRE